MRKHLIPMADSGLNEKGIWASPSVSDYTAVCMHWFVESSTVEKRFELISSLGPMFDLCSVEGGKNQGTSSCEWIRFSVSNVLNGKQSIHQFCSDDLPGQVWTGFGKIPSAIESTETAEDVFEGLHLTKKILIINFGMINTSNERRWRQHQIRVISALIRPGRCSNCVQSCPR